MCSGRQPDRPINLKAKLAGDDDFVAEWRECFSDQLFVYIGAVNFGCIEERDAFFKGRPNGLNALGYVCGRSVVGANAHAPGPEFRDFQFAEFSRLHFVFQLLPLPTRLLIGFKVLEESTADEAVAIIANVGAIKECGIEHVH